MNPLSMATAPCTCEDKLIGDCTSCVLAERVNAGEEINNVLDDYDITPVPEFGTEYTFMRIVNGMICGIRKMIYTSGVCFGLDHTGLRGRFCFDTMLNAKLFLKDWDGLTYPVVGDDGCTAIKGVIPQPKGECHE